MDDLYNNAQECMEFSNKEIIEYLVKPAQLFEEVDIRLATDTKEDVAWDTEEAIRYVTFDDDEEFFVGFLGRETILDIVREEFMFIDDISKPRVTSSDTYGNVVYEGRLRNKTHKEILRIIYDLFVIVKGTKELKIEETIIKEEGFQYPQCDYVVRIKKDTDEKSVIQFENIKFVIN